MDDRKKKYAAKLIQFKFCFRKDKDQKYIEFLKKCPNRTAFIRQAIDYYIASQEI